MTTPATLRDVAAAAGVHISTVSRVLRGERGRVRQETADRVVEAAESLGYTTNRWAASLRSGRTGVLGMLVPRITDPVLARVFESFEETAASAGYIAQVASTRDRPDTRREAIRRFVDQRVDGLVVADARLSDPDLEEIAGLGTPLVLASRRNDGFPFVVSDDVGGGREAGRHVAESGARRVAVLAGPTYASTAVDRTEGFLGGLADAGSGHEVTVLHSGFDIASGRQAMETLLERGRYDAVFAVNDYAAIGAMSVLARQGIVPGREVAVVGFNDIEICAELPVPLTSVRADLDLMGAAAFHSIHDLVSHENPSNQLVATELVVRSSSRLVAT